MHREVWLEESWEERLDDGGRGVLLLRGRKESPSWFHRGSERFALNPDPRHGIPGGGSTVPDSSNLHLENVLNHVLEDS